jgi:ABC-type antimicrobial peptide transport system permease subunit
VLSLAFAIGANSAIFSFADALLLRPLPVRNPALWMVSAAASYVPARRAAGLDPLRALRNE